MDFGRLHKVRGGPGAGAVDTWAVEYRRRVGSVAAPAPPPRTVSPERAATGGSGEAEPDELILTPAGSDPYKEARRRAIEAVFANEREMSILRKDGRKWGRIMHLLKDQLPESWQNRQDEAYNLVKTFMEEKFGRQDEAWHTRPDVHGAKVIHLGPQS
jgi:hypothetical protein